MAFWLAANPVLKDSPLPPPSMPGLHICYLCRTGALLWTSCSLVCPFSSGPVAEPDFPRSPAGIYLPLPLFPALLCLLKAGLRVSALSSFVGWRCALCCRYGDYDSPTQIYPRPSSKRYLSEAKCFFWITHSKEIILRKGLVAFSVLSCYNVLSTEPWGALCSITWSSLLLGYLESNLVGCPRKIPGGLPTAGRQHTVRREKSTAVQ